jgi:hypothetical protein
MGSVGRVVPIRRSPTAGFSQRGQEDRMRESTGPQPQDCRSAPVRNDLPAVPVRSVWLRLHGRGRAATLRLLARIWRPSPRAAQNTGKWDELYQNLTEERLWGDDTTYRLAAEYLADADAVEDWGCGSGGFRLFCKTHYIGVDGSATPFADKVVDLCNYTSSADGILLRHVLEHNVEWEKILHNAVNSFKKKLCIILFTPFGRKTRIMTYDAAADIVTLSFCKNDIARHFSGCRWSLDEGIRTESYYKVEHIFFISR